MNLLCISTKRDEYSPGHKVCLEYLKSGQINSFLELFGLIRVSRKRRKEAQMKEEHTLPELVEFRPSKLEFIGQYLTKCETAARSGNIDEEYNLRMKLGHYFHRQKNETWLAEHFYTLSYRAISKAEIVDSKKIILVLERLGCLLEERGAWHEALDKLEEGFHLAEVHCLEMTDAVRQSMYRTTHRICMKMGQQYLEEEEPKWKSRKIKTMRKKPQSLQFYEKALEMAEFAGAEESSAMAHARIGRIMLLLENHRAAIRHFNHFLDSCIKMEDKMGLCNGYLALSAVYENMGKIDDMATALDKCKEIALENNYMEALVPCYISMGQRATKDKNFEEAYEQFKKAHDILQRNKKNFSNYVEVEKLVRVCVGIAKAHLTFDNYAHILSYNSITALVKLIEWKDNGIRLTMNEEHETDL